MHGGLRANIKIKLCRLNHSMNVPYLHFWHLIYSNSEPVRAALCLSAEYVGDELEDDLVFEASVQVFVWEDDRVENHHLRWDVDVTTWGRDQKRKKKGGVDVFLHCSDFNLPSPPWINQFSSKQAKMKEQSAPAYPGWWWRGWASRPWRGSRCRSLRTGHWGSGHSVFLPPSPTFRWCCPIPQCCSKRRNDPGITWTGQIKRQETELWIYTPAWYEVWSNQIKTVGVYSGATPVKQIVLVGEMEIKINKPSPPKPCLGTSSHHRRRGMKLLQPQNH